MPVRQLLKSHMGGANAFITNGLRLKSGWGDNVDKCKELNGESQVVPGFGLRGSGSCHKTISCYFVLSCFCGSR